MLEYILFRVQIAYNQIVVSNVYIILDLPALHWICMNGSIPIVYELSQHAHEIQYHN